MRFGSMAAAALGMVTVMTPVAASAGSTPQSSANHSVAAQGKIQKSSNWSGYAEKSTKKGAYTSVGGSWTVPSVAASSGSTYSATWIGIDGDGNSQLIQTGTESDYVGGHARYDAWWEILPAPETVIPSVPVNPGDGMTALISKSGSVWTITITDTTTGKSFSFSPKSYKGPGKSIEWIEERPEIGAGLATLAKYGTVTFTGATLNGGSPKFVSADELEMVGNSLSDVISIPGPANSAGNAFSVAYGNVAPPAP